MPDTTPPDAFLAVSSHCPHCPALLASLSELVKRGVIGRWEVVNVEVHPDVARELGVRSVPWLRLGPYTLTGARSLGELELWAGRAQGLEGRPEDLADAFHDLLKQGDLAQVLALLAERPERLAALLPIVANPEASLNVRLGAGAVFESHAGSAALVALIPALCGLAGHGDARIRADACYCLGLARHASARACLAACLDDPQAEVREIAAEGLEQGL